MIICLDQRTGGGCGAENPEDAPTCQQCGRSLRFALVLLDPNTVVGSYMVVRLVGYGGGGAVYEALDLRDAQRVALKQTFDPTGAHSFRDEFAALSRVSHPGLPRYHELFDFAGNGYLVMEFIPGLSLQELIDQRGGPLPEAEALDYARQACAVVAFLHQRTPPLLHRDIKPANMRLTDSGQVKLVDFGLLKQAGQQTRRTIRGMGTPAYAPIEQYSTTGQHTDPRSDIYSLGATFYCLLSGSEPPPATERAAVTPDPLRPPQSLNPALTPRVAAALTRAMALVQHDRFARVEDFATALAVPVAVGTTPALPLPAHAPVLPLGEPITRLTEIRAVPAHAEGLTSLAIRADGELLACGSADDTATIWRVYDGSLVTRLVGHARGVNGLAFTADGAYVVTGSADKTVRFWQISDGACVMTLNNHTDWVTSLAASPDATTFATGSADGMLWLWVMYSGAPIGSAQTGSGIECIAWRPDGAAFATGHDDGTIQIRRADGLLLRTITAHTNLVTGLAWSPYGALLVSVSNDRTGMIWNVADGTPRMSLDGHLANVTCVAFAHDGATIVTGAIDGLLRAYRAEDATLLFEQQTHERGVNALGWLPERETLVTAGMDGVLRLWQARRATTPLGNATMRLAS